MSSLGHRIGSDPLVPPPEGCGFLRPNPEARGGIITLDPETTGSQAPLKQTSLSRRNLLELGVRAGVAAPIAAAFAGVALDRSAAAAPGNLPVRSWKVDQDTNTFTAIIAYGSPDIDPHSSYVTIGSAILLGAYEMLVQLKGDSTDEIAPMLAQSWEVSDDQSSYTFHLPAGATFHDGTACDAAAVKFSFTRFIQMGLGPYMVAARFITDPETQIVVVDPTTVQFNLPRSEPLFLSALASCYGPYVVSPAAVDANKTNDDPWAHEWFLLNAVGSGPYKLVENNMNEQIVFQKFDDYHGGWDGSHFDSVVMRVVPEDGTRRQLVETGESDALTQNITPEAVDALRSAADLKVLDYPSTNVLWIVFNAVKLPVAARQGLSYAFPYDDVINGDYKGLLVRTGPIARNVRGYDPNVFVYPTDLEKAKALLVEGGLAEGSTIDMMVASDYQTDKTYAELFQASLATIGYTLNISTVDTATLNTVLLGDQPADEKPMLIGSWGWFPDYNDSWNQLSPNFLKSAIGNGGGNAGAYVNDRFEALMTEAEHYDEATYNDLMKEAQNILTEVDPPVIYLGEYQYYTVMRSDIQGFSPNPLYLECYNFYGMSRQAPA